MTLRVIVRPQADADVRQLADHIAIDNPAAAERFSASFATTCNLLAETPQLGERVRLPDMTAAEARVRPISGFRNYLLFYRDLPDAIEVVRVVHGARDWESLFSE